MHLRNVREHTVIFLGTETNLPPVVVKTLSRPDIQQILLVVGRPLQRRVALLPGQPVEPAKDILRLNSSLHCVRVGISLRTFHRLLISPGQLAKFKCAAVTTGVEESVGKPARVHPHAGQIRRVETSSSSLGVGRV